MNQSEGGPALDRDLPHQLAQAQQQIVDLKSALEDVSSRLALAQKEGERLAENARLTEEEMRHFTYAVTHDLRQPLRGVLTSAQLLERETDLKDRIEELTSSIIQGSIEMNALIDRLSAYSRVASSLRRTVIPLSAVVQWALMNIGELVKSSGARITQGTLPTVDVDESNFTTLFQHLLTNGILYRGNHKPEIHIDSEEQDEGYVVSVRDNGCGVKEGSQEKIFAPFQRLHGHDIPGVGLGLPTCRKIIRAHGGRIWVESDGSNGSTFRFSIPA